MLIGNNYKLGSWTCEKFRPLTHIPKNSIILIKISSIAHHLIKREKTNIDLKKLNINGFWKFFIKNFYNSQK